MSDPLKLPVGEFITKLQYRLLGAEEKVRDTEDYFKGLFILSPYLITQVTRNRRRIKKLFRILRRQKRIIEKQKKDTDRIRKEKESIFKVMRTKSFWMRMLFGRKVA